MPFDKKSKVRTVGTAAGTLGFFGSRSTAGWFKHLQQRGGGIRPADEGNTAGAQRDAAALGGRCCAETTERPAAEAADWDLGGLGGDTNPPGGRIWVARFRKRGDAEKLPGLILGDWETWCFCRGGIRWSQVFLGDLFVSPWTFLLLESETGAPTQVWISSKMIASNRYSLFSYIQVLLILKHPTNGFRV